MSHEELSAGGVFYEMLKKNKIGCLSDQKGFTEKDFFFHKLTDQSKSKQ